MADTICGRLRNLKIAFVCWHLLTLTFDHLLHQLLVTRDPRFHCWPFYIVSPKNAPTLTSCSFDNDGLILTIFG